MRLYGDELQLGVVTVYSFDWAERPNTTTDRDLLPKKNKRGHLIRMVATKRSMSLRVSLPVRVD